MRKIFILSSAIFLSPACLFAQTIGKDAQAAATQTVKTVDDTTFKKGWKKGGVISVSVTQVNNSNWVAASGNNFSFSMAGTLNAFATKKWSNKTWDNVLDASYGVVNTTSTGPRKVNDLLNFVSKLGLQPNNWKNTSITFLGQLRSQIANGYDYNYFGSGQKRKNSGFFSPAYITIAPGIDWKPKPWLSVFASPVAARWTVVDDSYSFASPTGYFNGNKETPLATLYGVDSTKKSLAQFGAFVTITAKKEISKNVIYAGRIDLYSDYLQKPQNIGIFMTNQFFMKVNKWLSVTYELDFIYDDKIKQSANPTETVGLQVLSTLGVGIAAKF